MAVLNKSETSLLLHFFDYYGDSVHEFGAYAADGGDSCFDFRSMCIVTENQLQIAAGEVASLWRFS